MKKTLKIGIIGIGMVGGAIQRYFESGEQELFFYDKFKNAGSLEEINKADVIFIAVPTPFDNIKGFDASAVEDAIKNISGSKIIVIKSTVVPGTIESLQERYPQHKILFNPEFLTEATADHDMQHPDRQIIGYTKNSFDVAEDVLKILPDAQFKKIIPATEAELVKYFSNCFYSVKVVYANQVYDLCQKLGINYDFVKECGLADKWIGKNHLEVFHKGYRGYGGSCLPKDIRALIELGDKIGVDMKLLKTTESINNELKNNGKGN